MAQTSANLAAIRKEIYTQDTLEKMFYAETPVLDRFERTNKYTMGRYVRVPIWSYFGNGTTVLGAGGGQFSPDDAQDVQVADYTLSYVWNPIGLEFGALNEVGGGAASVGDALTLETEGAMIGLRRHAMRIAGGVGNGAIARVTSANVGPTITLDPNRTATTPPGNHAVSAGFLSPGNYVQIGAAPNGQNKTTTANPAGSAYNGRVIVDVVEDDASPQIILNAAADGATAAGDIVTLAHPAGPPTEFAGLRAIAGSTVPIGGLDPTVNGQRFWQPAFVDTTTTVYSLDLPLLLQRKVRSKTRKTPSWFVTSLKQAANHYSLLQTQVHFGGDMGLTAGADQKAGWNGLEFTADPDIPDNELYLLDPQAFIIATGKYTKPVWKSDVQGVNTGLDSVIGASGFKDALVYAFCLGIRRRNTTASAQALT